MHCFPTLAALSLFASSAAATPPILASGLAPGLPSGGRQVVVVGDSLAAGYRNGSLIATEQRLGLASLVAWRLERPLALPLVAPPGIPNVLELLDPGPPPLIVPRPGVSAGRLDPSVQPANLAVPGHDVADALNTRPDAAFDDLTDLVLGLPGLLSGIARSQVEWAEALAPANVIVWIGSNDVLGAALTADTASVTPLAQFEPAYVSLVSRLAATGANLVIANVPDVAAIPYLTSRAELAAATGAPVSVLEALLGLGAGDHVTPEGVALAIDVLGGASTGPLPAGVVLDATEIADVRAATDAINAVIEREAQLAGAAFVDMHAYIAWLDANGAVVDGIPLTTAFLGGLFSLDGIHPTRTGAALLANRFLEAIEQEFDRDLDPLPVVRVMRSDPLVPPFAAPLAGGRLPTPDARLAATLLR